MAQSPAAILNILLTANTTQANAALMKTNAQLKGTAATATAAGATMKKAFLGMGVAAGAAAVALYKVGEAFDDSYDTIRVQTGATGKDLEKLKKSFRDVVVAVPTDFETASKAIGSLNQRLGLTGQPLERMTKQFTELARITQTDVETNIAAVTRAFGDWEVQTKKQNEQLDIFFRASQDSGASVAELAEQVVQFGAPLRQVGFSLDEATAMFAQFEQAGVNTQTMMPGLKFALKSFMAAGQEPQQALAKTFEGISKGTIEATEAFEIFGQRATPDMIEAIQQGRFDLDKFTETITKHGDTVRDAGRDTMDFAEHWQKFKNQVLVGLEPLAISVFKGIGNAMEMLSKKAPQVVEDIKKAFSDVSFKQAIADMKEALRDLGPVFKFVRSVAERAFGGIKTWLRGLTQFLSGVAKFISGVFTLDLEKAWEGVKDVFKSGVQGVIGTLQFLTAPFRELAARIGHWFSEGPVADAIRWLGNAIEDIVEKVKWAADKIEGLNPFGDDELDAMVEGHQKSLTEVEKWSEHILNKYGTTHERTRRGFEDNARKVDGITKKQTRDVVRNTDNMVNATGEGLKRLGDNTNKSLRAFGAKPLQFAIDLNKSSSGGAFHGFQRGGLIPGSGSGDRVPIMAEPGEGFINKSAVKALGGAGAINAINSAIPRFASGGVVEALAPYSIPPFQYDANHAGGNSHMHIAMSTSAAVVALGRKLQQMGMMVGEHPAFGGVGGMHAPGGYHYSAQAIDVNTAANETRAEVASVARLLGGGGFGGVVKKLKRILLDGPAGPLRSMGQGALDKSWKAAQAFVNKSMPSVTSGNSSGVMNKAQIASVWGQANRGQGNAGLMAAIALAESSGNPAAVGNDPGGTRGLGLWQITTGFNDDLIRKYGGESGMFNPLNNAKAAGDLLARQGLGAWVVYNTGAYQQYLQRGGMPSLDRGGRVTQSGLAQVHPGDVHMGKSSPNINVYVDPVSLDVRVETIVEGMAPDIAEFTARQLGRGQGRSRQLSRG